jgi:hypothetical protein
VIDVQLANGWSLPAVLTLVRVTQHQVAAREAHGGARRAVVAMKMQDARNAQLAADDRERVVGRAHGERAPKLEIVRLAALVERMACASIEEDERTLCGRHLHRREVTVQKKYRSREDVGHRYT